jgi:hypothetical protein
MLASCGGPALQNVPHPNNAAMAGAAAAIAGAITLADPKLAGRKPEAEVGSDGKPVPVHEIVPSDVLDRADDEHASPPLPAAPPPAFDPSLAPRQ